jgi:NADH pyrophosphatase NudC (nudix superfamily)
MFFKESFDEERIKGKCEAIRGLDSQIKEKEEELKQVYLKAQEALGLPKTVAVCSCGAEIYEGTKFCGKCGKNVEEFVK